MGACTSGYKHETFIFYVFGYAEFKSARHPTLSFLGLPEIQDGRQKKTVFGQYLFKGKYFGT